MKSKTIIFLSITMIFGIFYSIICWYLKSYGYDNLEPMFFDYHYSNLLKLDEEIAKNLFLTYPFLSHFLTYPFCLFGAKLAPYSASIFYTSLFTGKIVSLSISKKNYIVSILLAVYFFCSPVTLYCATSGSSLYAYIISYTVLLYFLFSYNKKFSTHYLTLISIVFFWFVFLNYHILWYLLILTIPLFFINLKNTTKSKSATLLQFLKVSKNDSLRRKFLGRYFSIIMVVAFLPISIFLLYLSINFQLIDDLFYFKNATNSKWNANALINLYEVSTLDFFKWNAVNDFHFLKHILMLCPFFIWAVYLSRKSFSKITIILSIPLLIFLFIRLEKTYMQNLNAYVILIALGLALTIYLIIIEDLKIPPIGLMIFCVCSLAGELYYFKNTAFTSEKIYHNALTKKEPPELIKEFYEATNFLINNTDAESRILCDPTVMFPIISLNSSYNKFIPYQSVNYDLSIQNPQKFINYLILFNDNSTWLSLDKVKAEMQKNGTLKKIMSHSNKVVFSGRFFTILKINN